MHDWQSAFQSRSIPIPVFPPLDKHSVNFTGRLAREILRQTDPSKTIYLYPMSGWFHERGRELVGIRTFSLLKSAVGVGGVAGLDRLLSFMTVRRLQVLIDYYRDAIEGGARSILGGVERALQPYGTLPDDASALYADALAKCAGSKLWEHMHDSCLALGQTQLVRRQLSAELAASVRLDSHILSAVLDNANGAILSDIREHSRNPEGGNYPADHSPLLPELSRHLVAAGLHNPVLQIYVATLPLPEWPITCFLFTLSRLSLYTYDRHLSCLAPLR